MTYPVEGPLEGSAQLAGFLDGGADFALTNRLTWQGAEAGAGANAVPWAIDWSVGFIPRAFGSDALPADLTTAGTGRSSGVSFPDTGADHAEEHIVASAQRKVTSPTAVPEPATLALFGLGLLLARIVIRRRSVARTPPPDSSLK